MAFTYDLAEPLGKVRLYIADSRVDEHIFEDAELQAVLDMNGASVLRASADALDIMASNESMVQKAITLLDLKTDGPKVASDLRKHAAQLRAQADIQDAVLSDDPGITIAENPATFWAEREYLWSEAARA